MAMDTLRPLALFGLVMAILAVRRWRDGKSLRPTEAGVSRWVAIVAVIIGLIVLFVGGLVLAARWLTT